MLTSMTGYGRSASDVEGVRFTVEIRSVNNRYLDIQIRMPRSLTVLEQRIRKILKDQFFRGRLEVFIGRGEQENGAAKLVLDEELAEQYITAMKKAKERFRLPGEIDLPLLASVQEIVRREEAREDPESVWPSLETALNAAMEGLRAMRITEGAALVVDMTARLDQIEQRVASIRQCASRTVEAARLRMAETVKRLTGEPLDPVRMAQEIALIAERTDVTEELTRLSSHMNQLRRLLDGRQDEAVGRKIDFLLQEVGREANTIASKSQDAEISYFVVDIKAELEKIREQAQNIE